MPLHTIFTYLKKKPRPQHIQRTPRHRVQPQEQKQLMRDLKRLIVEEKGFAQLKPIDKLNQLIRIYEYKGKKVIIKNTWGETQDGNKPDLVRHAIMEHQKAVQRKDIKQTRYRIKTPYVYGKVGDYLVMEYMEGEHISVAKQKSSIFARRSLARAEQELATNFAAIENGLLPIAETQPNLKLPQLSDFMVTGNSNPRNPSRGIWYFSPPYDFA
jgi:hypothetical protein